MSAAWTSTRGIVLRDLVPGELRRRWVELGLCPDRDIYALFAARVEAHPDRDAVIDSRGAIDYLALGDEVLRIAGSLVAAGCGPRDVIGIQLPNDRRAVAAELAVAAIGAVALPYPYGRGSRDSLNLLGGSRATAAIVADVAGGVPLAANLAALRPSLPDLASILVFGQAPEGCRSLDAGADDELLGVAAWRPRPIDPEAPVRILVSSGSEAAPKMVAYTHNAMAGGRANYVGALHAGEAPTRNLVLTPLSSSYGSLGSFVTVARHGGTLVLLDAFDPGAALSAIGEHRLTHVFGVPTMLRRMTDRPRASDEDTSSLEAIVSSAAPLDPATVEACRRRFGCPVINIYGSSDGVNCHTGRFPQPPPGCAGLPDPRAAEIRIAGPDGQALPAGAEGEIWALGPMTPLCYVNAPELDARNRAPGGWVRSGDRGVLDGDGLLHVLDRMTLVVSRGGYKISPAEVERQLATHPAIAEVSCVPVRDGDLGERLCACVAPRPGAGPITLAALCGFLEDERGLERRKLPESLLILGELPLNPTGKADRQTLIRLAREQHEAGDARAPSPRPA
jgi:acyl-CoA synthetase (AMP-forming)/AMP-acid ligase II